MATTQEQIDAVENAIQVIVSGGVSEYTEAGKTYKNLTLKELREYRNELLGELYAENNGIYRPIVRGEQ